MAVTLPPAARIVARPLRWLRRPGAAALLALASGVGLAGLGAAWQARVNAAEATSRFQLLTARAVDQLTTRMQNYEDGLSGARGAVIAVGTAQIDRERFRRYAASRDLEREFPGARGFGVIRRVKAADEPAFVATVRRDGQPDFKIRQMAPHAGDLYPIAYYEPSASAKGAIGLDVASEVNRRTAAEVSMRSGAATITGPITLVRVTEHPLRSFLLMLPIYEPGQSLATAQAREDATFGWVFTPLLIDQVLKDFDFRDGEFSLLLRDASGGDAVTFFGSQHSELPAAAGLVERKVLPMFGRVWEVEAQARPHFVESLNQRQPANVGTVGTTLAALLALLISAYGQSARRAEQIHAEQAHLAAIVETSSDAIIGLTLDGVITDWNAAAHGLFGYPAAMAIGQSVASLLLPEELAGEDAMIRAAVIRGEAPRSFETVRRARDGTHIDVSVAVSPIVGSAGRIVGFAKTLRDISELKRRERQVIEQNITLEQQVADRTGLLETARHDLQAILDAVPSMIGYWDKNLVNRVANQAYYRWFEAEPGTIPGRHIRDLIGEERFEGRREAMEAALRGEAQKLELTMVTPGRPGVTHLLAHYIPDLVDGNVHGFYALVHDVTELTTGRLQLAAALRENEALLRTIHLHSMVSVANRAGRIVDVNDSFCRISGYGRDELVGQYHRIINSGEHDAAVWTGMWRTLTAGQPWRGEICNRAKDGSLYWVDSVITPFLGDDGRIEKYISISTDITAAKLLEQRLRTSEAFLDRAAEIAGVGGWELDLRTQAVFWSMQTYRIHEVEPGQQPPLNEALNFYAPEARAVVERAVAEVMANGTGWDLELPFVTAKGRAIWVRTICAAELEDGRAVRLVGAFQDITARKQSEAALAHERHLMTSLLETVPDQIYFKDHESRFLRINPGLARRYGLQHPSDAVGRSDADFFTAAHAVQTSAIERQIMASGEPVIDLEEIEFWPDRAPTWNLTTKMPLHDAAGRIVGTFGISRDITARKQIESQLQDSISRFALASDAAGIGVWEFDIASNTLSWDAWMYRIYGVSVASGTEPYDAWYGSLHPDDRARSEAELGAAMAAHGGSEFDTEFRIVRPSGEIRYVKAAARTSRGPDGAAVRMTGVNFDITERKRAEIELIETSSLLRSVLAAAGQVSIIATDARLNVKVFNAGAERLLGYTSAEVVGRATPMLIHDAGEVKARGEELSALLGHRVEAGAVLLEPVTLNQAREWTYVRKDGEHVPVSLVVSDMRTDDGKLVGYLSVAQDVTLQKQHEQSLREAKSKAEQANFAKSRFLANMSHEIRTPMNAVMGLSYLLGRTRLDPEQALHLRRIKIASRSLLAMINDVLDLSKVEAGELNLEHAAFSPDRLLRDLGDLMKVVADARGIGFVIETPPDLPLALTGDATRLGQVLTNLVANAIKFTECGHVSVRVRRGEAGPGLVRMVFVIEDTGIGMTPEVQARLFLPFAQADASITRRFGGSGLGLSIVKRLVDLMGGEVGLESTPAVGSRFSVVLDFAPAEPGALAQLDAAAPAPGEQALRGVRVLVVDDSEINLDVTRRILELEGALVRVAINGLEACLLLQAEPESIDVVLMDVQMPVLDGHHATRRIRCDPRLANLPIIALTADALKSERERAADAGMDDYIVKPFIAEDLVRSILRRVRLLSAAAGPVRPVDEAPPAPSRPAPLPWPEIDGIDGQDARLRLGHDATLFRSMLQRLLAEFGDLALAADAGTGAAGDRSAADPTACARLAARMHKLRGSAGTLGAKALAQLANQAEAAARAGETESAARIAVDLATELRRLDLSAQPVLAAARAEASGLAAGVLAAEAASPGCGPEIAAHAVADLVTLLRRQSFDALSCFSAISPQLARRLGRDAHDRLQAHIDNLRFADAAEVLEACA